MTSSGTYTYQPVIDELITESWERLGKSPSVLTGDVARSVRRSLQLMLIDWHNRGLNLWQVAPITVTLAAGAATLALDPSTVDVLDAYVSIFTGATATDYTMAHLSRDEYAAIPSKMTPSRPTQFWVERILPAPVLHFYPVPDQSYSLTYYRIRQPQDVSSLLQTPDAPVLWAEAIAAGLAARLALKFAPDRVELLDPKASEAFANAAGEDRERVPLTITPEMWTS